MRCSGDTMVICLQDTALVLIFSPKTKKGQGNLGDSLEQLTEDLWTRADLASVVSTLRLSLCMHTFGYRPRDSTARTKSRSSSAPWRLKVLKIII